MSHKVEVGSAYTKIKDSGQIAIVSSVARNKGGICIVHYSHTGSRDNITRSMSMGLFDFERIYKLYASSPPAPEIYTPEPRQIHRGYGTW